MDGGTAYGAAWMRPRMTALRNGALEVRSGGDGDDDGDELSDSKRSERYESGRASCERKRRRDGGVGGVDRRRRRTGSMVATGRLVEFGGGGMFSLMAKLGECE